MMPITSMEEIPVLTEVERTGFIASLKEGEASIKKGYALHLDAKSIKKWLFALYHKA